LFVTSTGVTDDEGEIEVDSLGVAMQGSECRPASFKVNQKLSMTTEEQISHAQRELALELRRGEDFQLAVIQSKAKCEAWTKRVEELKKQLEIEVTDASVVRTISSSLGPTDYLKHGSRVPQVFLTIFQNWTSTNLPWDEYWTVVQANLSGIKIPARVGAIIPGNVIVTDSSSVTAGPNACFVIDFIIPDS